MNNIGKGRRYALVGGRNSRSQDFFMRGCVAGELFAIFV
jgi:hypothetical protein